MSDNKKQLKIIFNDQTEELLKIYNSGDSIVKFLTGKTKYNNVVCNMLNTGVIKVGKYIKKGGMGAIYSIELPFGDKKEYVMKQKLDPEYESIDCLERVPYVFRNNTSLTRKEQTIPANSYVCENEQYSEYMIGVLVSQLYKNGLTPRSESLYNINFLDVLSFTTCHEPMYSQYIFMERITSDLKTADDLTQGDLISIVAQLLIAILFYQSIFKISHNDLHTGNIFLERITDKTKYNGRYLKDYGFISYNIYGKEYYVPLGKYLVKIGDWGLSCKYSKPMVLTQLVIDNFSGRDNYFDDGTFRQDMSIIPNVYRPSYDLIFSLIAMHQLLMMKYEKYNVVIDVIKQFIEHITDDDFDEFMDTISLQYRRPNLTKLKEYMSMQDIISEGVMLGDLMEKPNKEWLRVGQLI